MPYTYQRGLKSRHISLIALGGIIGSSYFLGTGYVLHEIGPSIFLAYILGGLITFLTMACLAELTIGSKEKGSFVSYIHHYLSPSTACGIGWSYWISWVVFIPSECLAGGILMHRYVPQIEIYQWAALFGLTITIINLLSVKFFGEMEYWLALIKILLLVGFSLLAFLIFFGWIGTHEPVGERYLLQDGGLFPNGYLIFFVNMVVLLSNFQGSEIIGLSASEAEHPHKNILRALKNIALRIGAFYILPTFFLALIYPWQDANLTGSVFSAALARYDLATFAHIFSFFIIAGALSCANSGLYATTRSLHALALRNMAPPFIREVNANGIPVRATLVTLGAVWTLLIASYFFSSHQLYANLLAISGFTGTTCWISICWAQIRFRRSLDHPSKLKFKTPFFPYFALLGIWLQISCLLVVVASPALRSSFYLGLPALVLPILLYKFFTKGKPT